MSNVTEVVTTTVKWVRVNALNHRKFKTFLIDIDADYGGVVMFTAVRWLSCSKCLRRIYDLYEIKTLPKAKKTFLSSTTKNGLLIWLSWWISTTHLSFLNRTLQGNNKLCHDLYSITCAFIKKLCLWKTHLASGDITHFFTLSNHPINKLSQYCIASLSAT